MNKIDLLVPTRERLNLQLTLISSIITTAKNINNINLYFGVDQDDKYRDITIKMSKAISFVHVIDIDNQGKFIGLGKIWNQLAKHSDQNILGYIGDDMIFKTPNWDEAILKEFDPENCPKDNIKLVHCNDGHRNGIMTVNAFVHRKYYETLGYFVKEDFLINWSDHYMMQLFQAFDRITYKPDILIEHNHWVFFKRPIDDTGKRMQISDKTPDGKSISDALWDKLGPDRDKDALKLAKVIGIEPDWSKIDNKFRDKRV